MPVEVPFRYEEHTYLWLVENVYTPAECQDFIELIERSAPRLATDNASFRDQDRVVVDDVAAAEILFKRLRPHLPESMGDLQLVGLNERLRYYRYRMGQSFSPHMDHWHRPSDTQISLFTVLVYFNDDFEGGETKFMEQLEQIVVPRQGMAAIFQHTIRHEGCSVKRGVKYALRTDVIYGACS